MSSFNKFLFFMLTLALLARELVGERDFIISVDYVSCIHNPEYIKSSNCSVDKNNPPRLYLDVHLQRDIKNALVSIKLIAQQNKNSRTFVNIKNQNGCDLLGGNNLNKMAALVRSYAKRYVELPKRCPVKKEFHFLVKKMILDPNYFPTFTPDGNFTLRTTLRTEKDFLFSYESRGMVRRKYRS